MSVHEVAAGIHHDYLGDEEVERSCCYAALNASVGDAQLQAERRELADQVEEAGWPAVAEDIRAGTALSEVRKRCRETLSENEQEALLGVGGVL